MAVRTIASVVGGCLLGSIVACGGSNEPGAEAWVATDGATTEADASSGDPSATGDDAGTQDDTGATPSSSTGGDPATDTGSDDSGGSTGGPALECPQVRVLVAPGASLNVRPSPSTAGEPVGSLANGEVVDVLEEVTGEPVEGTDAWLHVASADIDGFVSTTFTACTIDECALVDVPNAEYLTYGLHPDASDALQYLRVSASGITQTIGNAPASAGTHASDGTAEGHDYSCATDLSVSGLDTAAIHQYIADLAAVGYAGWYRQPGADGVPSDWSPHIHAVWVGAPMKASLRDQIRSWVDGGNGLATEAPYNFHQWPQCLRDALWERYLEHNPADG